MAPLDVAPAAVEAGVELPPDATVPSQLGFDAPRFGLPAAAPPPTAANGLPLLESLPGAPVAVYLDFDGFSGSGFGGQQTHSAYNIDGDATTFSATEQANIIEGWTRIAAHFAPFHVNVTTVVPTTPKTWTIITPSFGGPGYSYGQFNGFAPSSFNPQGDLLGRTSGILHEIGHDFGLGHQAEFDLLGNQTREYRNGYDQLHAAIMGVDYNGSVPKWYIGHRTGDPSALQDDIARIVSRIIPHQGPGGDGFRPDDHGGTIATATALVNVGGMQQAEGIIERMTDADLFAFTSPGGVTSIAATRRSLSGLDMKLEVYAADGTLVAASDTTPTDQRLALPLPPGAYYAAVKSHGDYSDLGPYNLSVSTLPAGWDHRDVGNVGRTGFVSHEAGVFTVAGSGSAIGGTSDQFQFAFQKLTGDGEIVARVTSVENTNASAKAGVMIRETTSSGSRYVSMLATPENGTWMRWRSASGGNSADSPREDAPFAPVWLRLVRSGNTFTGYTSLDGINWTLEGTATVNMAQTVQIGLATTASDNGKINHATYDNVNVDGTLGDLAPVLNGLSAPAGLTISGRTPTAISLSWDDVSGENGYVIERSADGAAYVSAGATAAGVTTFNDSALASHQRFFYRVRARDAAGVSVASEVVHGVTRPGPVTGFAITNWTGSALILNWRETSGETGYRIERSTDGASYTTIATVGVNVPSYTDTGLTGGTTYHYRVVALDGDGDAGVATATGATRVSAASGFQFTTVAADEIELRWTDTAGETEYVLERSIDGEEYMALATLPADSTSYTDASVSASGEFYYRLRGNHGATPGDLTGVIFTATPGDEPLPAPWTSSDVGNLSGTGAAGHAAGTFTLISSGTDLENTTDSLHYLHQPLAGDGTIIARLATLEATADNAEVGLMVRESLANNAKSFAVVATPALGVKLRFRTATGGNSTTSGAGPNGPQWLKLVRAGNTFTGFTSVDGLAWTQLGGPVAIAMPGNVFIGLASVSHESDVLNTSTFDNVQVGLPAPIARPESYQVDEDGSLTTGQPVEIAVAFGAAWKYLDDGSNQASGWRASTFADGGWQSGAAPLGFGDPGLVTTVSEETAGGDPITTTYFRREFNVSDASSVTQIVLRLVRDDGAAVYLNGREIVRSNLAAGAAFDAFAETAITGGEETTPVEFTIDVADLPAGTLVAGRNVLAVEVHQEGPTSSDLRFDLQLELHRPALPPVLANDFRLTATGGTLAIIAAPAHGAGILAADGALTYTPEANYFGGDQLSYRIVSSAGVIVPVGGRWKYLDNGSNQGSAWRAREFDDSAWPSGPAELGYGESDEATVIASGPSNARIPTTYFRKTVVLPPGVTASELSMRLVRDDAAAVYINGTEVYRDDNLPAGAAYDDYATSDIPGSQENAFVTIALPAATLASGANVIAVEVHQADAVSSDVSFNFELSGRLESAPAAVSFTVLPTPDPPTATGDAFEAAAGQPLVVDAPGVLLNDQDLDGDPLRSVLVSAAAQGALALAADGSFTYTPGASFAGVDSFTYRVTDDVPRSLVPRGATWRYRDDGSDQGTAWRAVDFIDSSWPAGMAELGYGEEDQATTIDCGPSSPDCDAGNYATSYFRHTFQIADASLLGELSLFVLRDDAAAVYLNGQEIFRDENLPAGADHSTYATSKSDENATTTISIDAALLVDGPNVIAVEVHQAADDSSDVSFDLSLTGKAFSEPTTVTIEVTSTGTPGDFSGDGRVTVDDIDMLLAELAAGGANLQFDVTADGNVTMADLDRVVGELVETVLGVGTAYGDVNLDGAVDRRDAAILAANMGLATAIPSWQRGDFDASSTTDLADLARLQANLAAAEAPGASPSPAAAIAASTRPVRAAKASALAAGRNRAMAVDRVLDADDAQLSVVRHVPRRSVFFQARRATVRSE